MTYERTRATRPLFVIARFFSLRIKKHSRLVPFGAVVVHGHSPAPVFGPEWWSFSERIPGWRVAERPVMGRDERRHCLVMHYFSPPSFSTFANSPSYACAGAAYAPPLQEGSISSM